MLLWIGLVLLVLWAVGFLLFHLGGVIHLVLLAALVMVIVHWVRGRGRSKAH